MKFNNYVIAVVNDGVTRLCSVKAKNSYHAIVKALIKLDNEEFENDFDALPTDGNLLYEKFIKKDKSVIDLKIEDFVSKFTETYFGSSNCPISAVMENGVEIYNKSENSSL